MGKIYLKNIRLYAFHGCMDEEGKIGSDYLVNVTVEQDLASSSKSDRLEETYRLCFPSLYSKRQKWNSGQNF